MSTTVSTSGHSWWYHWAVVGKAAGVAIGAGVGIAQFVPVPAVQIAAAVVGGVATVVTGYAEKGIQADTPSTS